MTRKFIKNLTFLDIVMIVMCTTFIGACLILPGCGDNNVIEPADGVKSIVDIPKKSGLDLPPFRKTIPFNTILDTLTVPAGEEYEDKDVLPIAKGAINIDGTTLVLNAIDSYDPLRRKLYYSFSINGEHMCNCKYGIFDVHPEEDLELVFRIFTQGADDEGNEYLIGTTVAPPKIGYAQAMSKNSVLDTDIKYDD